MVKRGTGWCELWNCETILFVASLNLSDADKHTQKEQWLERENQRLKQVVSELTVELKKRLVKSCRRRRARIPGADAELLPLVRVLKAEHPIRGYRRVWAHLRLIEQKQINPKRVYRLMKETGLLVPKDLRLRAERESHLSKPRPAGPNQWWGVDITKVITAEG